MSSTSGAHTFDLSSSSLDEDAEERHDTTKMLQSEILAMLEEMEKDGLSPEERFGASESVIPPEGGSGVYVRHDTLRPPPDGFGYAVNDD